MTIPGGTSSTPTASGTTGRISTLAGDTQPNVINYLKGQQYPTGGGPSWWSLLQGFGSAVTGAISGLQAIITGIGGTIATDVSDTILTIRGIANGAQTAINQIITGVGGTIATDVANTILTVQGVANTVQTGLSTLGNNLLHSAQTVIGDISGVVADATHTLQNIWDAIGSGLGGATSGHTAATLNAQAVALAITAQDAEAAAYAAQWTLQQQAGSSNSGSTGATFEMDINGTDGAALPSADWAATSNMDVRVTNNVAAMGITAGTAVGAVSYANCAHTYLTNSQSIAVVLGPKGDDTAPTTLHFHCNTAFTAGLYLSILTTGVTLGYFTGALGSRTYTPFTGGTLTQTMSSGMRAEVRDAGTNTYSILINGVPTLTVSDPGAHAVAGNKSAQITQTSRTVVYNAGLPWQTTGTNYSFQLASILLSDYIIPTYVGSNAAIYRTSTGTVSLGSSGSNNVLGSSFFGVTARSTPDITVDLTNSKFTVSVEDMYLVTVRAKLSLAVSGLVDTGIVTPLLYLNGSLEEFGPQSLAWLTAQNNGVSGQVDQGAMTAMHATFQVYLRAGDYVQPGWNNASASGTLTGEATGTQTFFRIARMGAAV